jgi:16S rRNA (guanine966-N2)-methyltransferase
VREAVLSAVISRIGSLDGVRVVDLYAGSGAFGIECLSRGAAHVTLVESDRRAADTITANLRALGATRDEATVLAVPVERVDPRHLGCADVSLLFADPPYRIDAACVSQVLEALGGGGALEQGALVVYEHATGSVPMWPGSFAAIGSKRYGDTTVSYAAYEE